MNRTIGDKRLFKVMEKIDSYILRRKIRGEPAVTLHECARELEELYDFCHVVGKKSIDVHRVPMATKMNPTRRELNRIIVIHQLEKAFE